MADGNRGHQRSSWSALIGLGLIGLVAGALAGHFGYSFAIVAKNPLVSVSAASDEQPFEQTFREMARLAGLEVVAGKCDSAPDPKVIDQEKQLIDQIEVSSKKANLNPPLSVARAVVAYRSSAAQQETAFLEMAGWSDTSPDHFANIVRDLDGCQAQNAPKEKQQ
jgi:hypothetical protein